MVDDTLVFDEKNVPSYPSSLHRIIGCWAARDELRSLHDVDANNGGLLYSVECRLSTVSIWSVNSFEVVAHADKNSCCGFDLAFTGEGTGNLAREVLYLSLRVKRTGVNSREFVRSSLTNDDRHVFVVYDALAGLQSIRR